MNKILKVGILRETKNPPDRRTCLTPAQIIALEELYPFLQFYVQPSDLRSYSNNEYKYLNIPVSEQMNDCDILMGIKEVDIQSLIPDKTYMIFAHVAKKQSVNREMFKEMAANRISLIDYEYLTDDKGKRLVAFGRWAGIVGAYNALRARGIRTNRFKLKPAYQCHDLDEMWAGLRLIDLKPGLKILITGNGRVANGALETLSICNNLVQVEPDDFLNREFDVPVVCQIGPEHYTRHKKNQKFSFSDFTEHPGDYVSNFLPYITVTDILITGHYWDPRSPAFFTKEDMKRDDFRISIIADISCDINGPIPSTLRPTTITDPFYGYNPSIEKEEPAFIRPTNITVMAIDNLPGELPRDASLDFGRQLMRTILHELFSQTENPAIERAMILRNGELTPSFSYLEDYLSG